MRPLLRKAWKALVNDEMAARRWARGLLIGFGVSGVGAVPYAPEGWRLYLVLGAGLAGCIGALINLGQKNPSPEAVTSAVEQVQARREVGIPDPPIPPAAP